MFPTSDSKSLPKCQGPFEVQRKLGSSASQVSTPGLQGGSKVLHVKLLKEWIPRTENKMEVLLIHSVDEGEEVDVYLPLVNADHILVTVCSNTSLGVFCVFFAAQSAGLQREDTFNGCAGRNKRLLNS